MSRLKANIVFPRAFPLPQEHGGTALPAART